VIYVTDPLNFDDSVNDSSRQKSLIFQSGIHLTYKIEPTVSLIAIGIGQAGKEMF
jgi:hypothetical protein